MANGPCLSSWFWELLESSGHSLRTLRVRLAELPEADLRQFYTEFDEAKGFVNPGWWAACHPYLTAGCSEDHADDFAAWVVMQGRAFYDEARAHPERVMDYLAAFGRAERDARRGRGGRWARDDDAAEFQGLDRGDYLANRVYRHRFGTDIP